MRLYYTYIPLTFSEFYCKINMVLFNIFEDITSARKGRQIRAERGTHENVKAHRKSARPAEQSTKGNISHLLRTLGALYL